MFLLIAIVLFGGVLGLIGLYRRLWMRSQQLEQQIQTHQQRMEQAWIEIHNGPLQVLAFLMREVQLHDVTQQDLLQHLQAVYQDVHSGVQKLQDYQSD